MDIVCEVPWVSRHALLLQGTGVKHRLSLGLAAENNHKVGGHDSLAVLVELNNAILGELSESHVDHRNGTLDDLFTCSDDCLCLLAAEHCLRNLGSVGQVREASVVNGDTSDGKVAAQLGLKRLGDLLDVGAQGNCGVGLGLVLRA